MQPLQTRAGRAGLTLAVVSLLAAACVEHVLIDPARHAPTDLAVSLLYGSEAEPGPGWTAAYDSTDQVWVQLSRGGTAFHDETTPREPGADWGALTIEIELEEDEEEIAVVFALLRGADPLFRGDTTLVLGAGEERDAAVALEPVAAVVELVPLPESVEIGDTLQLRGAALFATLDTITTALDWSVLDTGVLALIDGDRVVVMGPGTARVQGAFGGAVVEGSVPVAGDPTPVAIGAGFAHTCVVTADGGISCWGVNWQGHLGSGTNGHYSVEPLAVAASGPFASVAAGSDHTCALKTDGQAYCWGLAENGRLGNGETGGMNVLPAPVLGGLLFSTLASGSAHTCGIAIDGVSYCWGSDSQGQLGTGGGGDSDTPTTVAGGMDFTFLTTGSEHTCALTAGGDAYCWGWNDSGQLGNGTTTGSNVPALVAGGMTFTHLAAGSRHTCGVASGGAAYCWGAGGLLGTGDYPGSTMPAGMVIGDHTFTRLVSRSDHTCGLTPDGSAYCWGGGRSGQLGDGSSASLGLGPAPVAGGHTFQSLTAGGDHSCGLADSGQVYCWGLHGFGRLGDGSAGLSSTPRPVASNLAFQTVDAGNHHSACGIAEDGGAHCWGQGYAGKLGVGDDGSRPAPTAVAGGLLFRTIDVAWDHVCALTTGDLAYCWGEGGAGQIGDGQNENRSEPRPVSGARTYAAVVSGRYHACGLTGAGEAYCWGHNSMGELGDGTTLDRNTPVAVTGSHTFVALAAAHQTTCGLTGAGDVYCWGENGQGELGTGSTGGTSTTPVLAATPEPLTSIHGGTFRFCGLTAAGAAYCWGATYQPLPGPLDDGGIVWAELELGEWSDCGVSTDGQAYCWGDNHSGQLGDGTHDGGGPRPTAVPLRWVSAGRDSACGIDTAGAAYCWGHEYDGALGNGSRGYSPVPVAVVGLPQASR